jgi:hypothetical protein
MTLLAGISVCVIAHCALPAARARADGHWPDEQFAGAFLCHADFSLANHKHLLDEMAQLQRDLVRTLAIDEPHERIHLFLFNQKSTYDAYLQKHFPDVPTRRALYIKEQRGPGMVFAYRSDEFEVAFDHPHLSAMKWQLSKVNLAARIKSSSPSLERLEDLSDLKQMGAAEYRQSWAWVHFMLHGSPEAQEELIRFLSDIRAQTPPGKLSHRLRSRIPNLDERFADHLRQWKR